MNTNQCPSSTITGWQFNSHFDCVNAGYGIAQRTYQNLEELENWDKQFINDNKMVIKFECKAVKSTNT